MSNYEVVADAERIKASAIAEIMFEMDKQDLKNNAVALISRMSVHTLNRIMHGSSNVTLEDLVRIGKAVGIRWELKRIKDV